MIITNFSENDRYFNEKRIFFDKLEKDNLLLIFSNKLKKCDHVFTEQTILLNTQIYWMNNVIEWSFS